MARLTDKQQRFADEYLIDLNATQAAVRAGYSAKTAAEIARQNLRKLEISKVIEQHKIEMKNHLQERFALDAAKAREVMYAILTDEDAINKDRIAVARDFLDRAGYKPMEKVEHSGEVNNPFAGLTTEELRRLAGTSRADD